MRRAVIVAAIVAASSGIGFERPVQAQEGARAGAAADLFTGSWKINRAKSHQQTGQPPIREDITISVENNVQTYTVEVQNEGAATATKNRLVATYNDGKYYPYTNQGTGQVTSQVMMIRIDPRTEYRFMKNAQTGQSTGVLMRRMAEDGKSYTSTMMTLDGQISLVRVFERQ